MHLKTKFITIITIILLLVVGGSTVVALFFQERRVMESKLNDASMIGQLVHQSIRDAMKRGNSEDVQKIVSNIGDNAEIRSLRILSRDGEILKSITAKEVGTESREYPVSGYAVSGANSIRMDDTIMTYRVIKNEPACYQCHDKKYETIGVIEMGLDISRHQRDIASMKRFLLLASIITILSVAVILSLLFTKNIINPLKALTRTISDVEQGDWDSRVSLESEDEIGFIGNSFNTMLDEIKKLYDRNIKRERELYHMKAELENKRKLEELNSQLSTKIKELEKSNKTVLFLSKEVRDKNEELSKMVERLKRINEVGKVLGSIIETDKIIKLIIQTSAEILYAEKGAIHIDRDENPSLTLRYTRESGVERLNELSFDFKENYSQILSNGKPLVIMSDAKVRNEACGTERCGRGIGVPLKLKGKIVGAMLLEEKVDGTMFTDDELELLSTLSSHAMVAIENAWLYEKLKFNYFSTIQSLVNALEASDPYTKGHSERVRYLSVEVARYLNLDPREIDALEHAAILHDIGKIGIDSALLNKEGRLTREEFQIIKDHPVIGEEIIGPIDALSGVRATILQHHEQYDGGGYPSGLAGEEIILKARILAVADTFDAMVTQRPYRDALLFENALEEIQKGAGSQFDPSVVEVFVTLINAEGRRVLTEAGYGSMINSIN